MERDNETKEAFAFWKHAKIDAHIVGDRFAAIGAYAGIVVDEHGVSVRVEGARGTACITYLDPGKELALYEALRTRFDERHREMIAQTALAKLTPLEQEALRQRWSKVAEPTAKGPSKTKERAR